MNQDPLLLITKIDKQGLYLIHKISLVRIDAELPYNYGIYCTYKAPKLSGLLWVHYLNCKLLYAKRFSYLMADHLDFAPLWAKYRSRTIEPIATYWQIQAEGIESRLNQLQDSAIIKREPTEDPSGL